MYLRVITCKIATLKIGIGRTYLIEIAQLKCMDNYDTMNAEIWL